MKTLLLTSGGMTVQEEIMKILPKPASQIKLAHVITASKLEKKPDYFIKDREKISAAGFQVEEIVIEGKNENDWRQILADKDVIFVQGGNTFYILKVVKETGFDKVVKDLIEEGKIYIGVSAGSYLVCPTIETAAWKHADQNTVGLTDWRGLNLVPFLLLVHYDPKYKEILKKEIKNCQYPVRILTDQQAILIRNGKVSLVGQGPEILL